MCFPRCAVCRQTAVTKKTGFIETTVSGHDFDSDPKKYLRHRPESRHLGLPISMKPFIGVDAPLASWIGHFAARAVVTVAPRFKVQ
jgi:hypothetical protein